MPACGPRVRTLVAGVVTGALAACGDTTPAVPPLYTAVAPDSSGVRFTNTLPERADFNILNYLYYYNGGGVAVGDVDGDGRQDLYFSANIGPNRLYRNLGGYRFEDITDRAGVAGPPGWKTGVSMADVNGDGHVDIYVSAVRYLGMQGRNALYINDGDGTFTDRTDEYGVGHVGYSTQAAFLDYDGDGDLDLYLLNHSVHTERGIGSPALRRQRHPRAGDRLLRNDGARFTDVSDAAGIYGGVEGYGLGVVVSDLDGNGCPDLYIANDFQENDYLYRNNCNGTFTESIAAATGHTSRFSMGVDAADITNDGLPDLFVADMLPEREEVLKTSASSESFTLFDLRIRAGYHPQLARNTLQLNRGDGRFSDVAFLAGVHATDWTWAPLFADLDDDGRKDLFITSGIYRRPNDLDYINYASNETVQASLARGISAENLSLLQRLPQIPMANHAFRNDGDLRFTNMATPWGLGEPGFSNGAVYVDLDNRGVLDLVVNRINAPALVYRHAGQERTGHGSLTITLRGAGRNTAGVGAQVTVVTGATRQVVEQSPVRGFQSSVDPRLHVGLGRAATADSVIVQWPDRRRQVLTGVAANRRLTLWQDSATAPVAPVAVPPAARFATASAAGLQVRHVENEFLDFNREPLMPHLLSTEGPALAVADVNGDGLDDVYLGGARGQAGSLLLQDRNGGFAPTAQALLAADSVAEDVDAAFFDADGDRDLDLYVVSGGNEFFGADEALRDRLYLNDGRGGFTKGMLPVFHHQGSCVAPGDFDGDGDLDLFVGSRVVARAYGTTPTSTLLRNDGNGRFVDVTATVAPVLATAGMVSDCAWVDQDGDRRPELVVIGEWMPVRVFAWSGGRFTERTRAAGLDSTEGWWTRLLVTDLNGDGRQDLVLGNLGLNAYLRASPTAPARLYVADFGRTGAVKSIITFDKQGTSYPLAGRDELVKLMPVLRSKYPSYAAFGASQVDDIFPPGDLRQAVQRVARTFASTVALAGADGRYTLRPLPAEAQIAPLYGLLADDVDGDGRTDLLLGGNFWGVPPLLGRYDASEGQVLLGRGDGSFVVEPAVRSGLRLSGQVRGMAMLRTPAGRRILVARNNDTPILLAPATAR